MAESQRTEGDSTEGDSTEGDSTEGLASAYGYSRRVVLGAAATLGTRASAGSALAAGVAARPARATREAAATAPGAEVGDAAASQAAADSTAADSAVWGASGHGTGVRGNGRFGVVGEGTHSGVLGDGFVGVRGSTSILEDDRRGVGVWAQAAAPGSTALRADGPSEFTGVTTFSRSGVTAVHRGSASVTVTGVALTADTAILATLQHRENGVHLHAVETNAAEGAFTIFLTAAPGSAARVAWFAIG